MANGKGDWRRPGDEEAFRRNWDSIFGPKKSKQETEIELRSGPKFRKPKHEPGCMSWQAWDISGSCTCGAPKSNQDNDVANNPPLRNAPIVKG